MATNILVVEDQRAIAGAMRMRLRGLGYGVLDIAKDGDEAIEKATELRPDLILMDIRLGDGIDGIEAARRIRAQLDIPVVYVTAYADRDLLDRARTTQPAGFINKPFTTKDLLTTINLALAQETHSPRTLTLLREAVIAADVDGRINFINAGAERITGWSRAQLNGRPLREALSALYGISPAQCDHLLGEVRAHGREQHVGGEDDASDIITVVRDNSGTVVGLALHFGADAANASLAGIRRTQRVLHHVLDQVSVGVMVVDRQLRVIYHNRVAQEVVARRAVLVLESGVLRATETGRQQDLLEMVETAVDKSHDTDAEASGELVLMGADDARIALVVTRGSDREPFADDTLATVLLFDLDQRPQLSGSALRELYGLTRSEISLAQALAGGTSLEEGARELGIAVNTARTHLKHVFHKTGARRQSELIHQIESGPSGLPLVLRRRD